MGGLSPSTPKSPGTDTANLSGMARASARLVVVGFVKSTLLSFMRVDKIKASAFLRAERLAACSGAGSQVFKQIKAELRKLPMVEERLAFEFLELAWLALQSGQDPLAPAFQALLFRGKIGESQRQKYAAWITRLIFKTFEVLGEMRPPIDENNRIMFTFQLSLTTLRVIDRAEFESIVNLLRARCQNTATDSRLRVINEVTASQPQQQNGLWKLGREVKLLQLKLEEAARANVN
jgi:hypothetical protein